MADYSNKIKKAEMLECIPGHPLQTFVRENEVLQGILNETKTMFEENKGTEEIARQLKRMREVSIHYAKKGDLLYPLLKTAYEIAGPSDLMWTSDDEIRDELSALVKAKKRDDVWLGRIEVVMKEMEQMIYKDDRILFPICAVNFTEEDWIGIYKDSKDYATCFDIKPERWEKAEETTLSPSSLQQGMVVLPGGSMSIEQLTALLNTIPLEITFIDDENINRFFNEGPKEFKRPKMAIGREVFSCHPPKIEEQVRKIIESFRAGSLDSVPMWMEKNGRIMSVTYLAVRDKNKKYLGTVELVQDMEHAREYFKDKLK